MTITVPPPTGAFATKWGQGGVIARPSWLVAAWSALTPVSMAAYLLAFLVALPILSLAWSLTQTGTGAVAHMAETVLVAAVANTIGMLAMVAAGCLIIGVGAAWAVTAFRFPGSRALEWLLLLPLAMPAFIIGYAYTDVLAFAGPVQRGLREAFGWSRGDYWFPDIHSLWGVSLMLTLVLYPYVYMLARAAFTEQSACIMDASRALGGSLSESFWRIALPMARPAIAAGLALALMEALADFGTVQYFGIHTFTTLIYRAWFGMGDRVAAAQFSIGLLCFVLLLMALELRARNARRFGRTSKRERVLNAVPLRGWRAALAFSLCGLPVLFGFIVPVGIFLAMHVEGGDPVFGPRFIGYATNSVMLAGLAAVIIVLAGATLAYALRLSRGPALTGAVRFATLGYAIPGTVIAVGVLIPLGAFDNAVDAFARQTFGFGTGLLISGTVAAMLFAYLVRFLAISTHTIEAGYHRIGPNIDHVARTLGASQGEIARRLHAPMLWRSLITAGLIVFVDVTKELPATLIVRPFNFDTLAVRVYSLASDERLMQASTSALAIVAIGVLPVLLLMRATRGRD
jgi:iron(III) transport system permease protein